MEKKEINILIADDHPMIIEGYKDALASLNREDLYYKIDTVNECDLAWEKIKAYNYDILFLDISFSQNENSRFVSGEDLGEKIKKEYPHIKIIILTQIEDAYHLKNIIERIHPEGFLIKRETNPEGLRNCVKSVMNSVPFYSPKISKVLQSLLNLDFRLTENDRIILHQLSLGTKTKDLHHYLPLSYRAIEDRKRKLKEYFGANDDRTLLNKAKEQGYL